MDIRSLKMLGLGAFVATLSLAAPSASAVLIGNTPGGPQADTSVMPDSTTVDGMLASWTVGSSSSPVPVEYMASRGLWAIKLEGSPLTEAGGGTFQVHEYLQIGNDSPNWTHWSQEFATEGFNFTSGQLMVDGDLVSTGDIGTDHNAIDFNFDTLSAGTVVEIVKNFSWDGTKGGEFQDTWSGAPQLIQFRQFPNFQEAVVPEPATIGLAGIGLSLMFGGSAFRKRRRRA